MTLDEITTEMFKHLSNQALLNRANIKPDFKWDDEEHELNRRRKASNNSFNYAMQGNKLVIIFERRTTP